MEILELVKRELIFPQIRVDNYQDLFQFLASHLQKQGYVKKTFLQGLLDREEQFPTGLRLGKYGCALPHTDKVHVVNPVIAVASLKEPVLFRSMEDGKSIVPVNLVFMLALNKSEYQLLALKQLASIIQDVPLIQNLVDAKDRLHMYSVLTALKK